MKKVERKLCIVIIQSVTLVIQLLQKGDNYMFDYNQPKPNKNRMYRFDEMKIGECQVYRSNVRDSLKTVLWRVTKKLGYKYKTSIIDGKAIVTRIY